MALNLLSGSVYPSSIETGDQITVSWSWSGNANTSSYFDIYANGTRVNSVHPNSASSGGSQSISASWGQSGTWSFSVTYRENGDSVDCGSVTASDPQPETVILGTCSVYPTSIGIGGSITLSWNYSGTGKTSSYFDIYASQTPNFLTATLINSVHYPSTSVSASWGNAGTWYFWVVYRGTGSRTTNYATLKVLQNAWMPLQSYIFVDYWRTTKMWMFINSAWRVTKKYIFKE